MKRLSVDDGRRQASAIHPSSFILHHLAALAVSLSLAALAHSADLEPPEYAEGYLTSIYPAGAQRGTTVEVEFRGWDRSYKSKELHGLKDALGIVVDGPPGITVGKITNASDILVKAELTIAPDAAPGRRMLRVRNGRTGLTNFSYFVVGTLPEVLEKEPNTDLGQAQSVALPVVVNGSLSQVLDVDCFRFEARRGQRLTAAVTAHGIDSRSMLPRGFVDAALEVLDSQGAVIADAADVLGLDPLVDVVIPADGAYTARVKLVNFQGFRDAVYRLTLGEVPFATAAFPVAVERGKSAEITFAGPGIAAGAKSAVALPVDWKLPMMHVAPAVGPTNEVALLASDLPEAIEHEPNDDRAAATAIVPLSGTSGRFDRAGDVDWYRLALKKGDSLRCEIHAQRYLRSAVDTHLALYDAKGELISENDDFASTDIEMFHDFEPFDSAVNIDCKADGDYYLRVSEQTGAAGERAVYHLRVTRRGVDLRLHAWPDAVPVFGPGCTSAFVATIDRVGASNDVELRVEGLPAGWVASTGYALGGTASVKRSFITLTAPADAKPGDMVEFRVVGRTKNGNGFVERVAQPLTAYTASDRQICRVSPQMRAVVARDLGLRLSTEVRELNVVQGQNAELVVNVDPPPGDVLPVSVNLAGASFKCTLGVQQKLPVAAGKVRVPIKCDQLPPGRHAIVASLAWGSELRIGMPAVCTPIVFVNITAATASK